MYYMYILDLLYIHTLNIYIIYIIYMLYIYVYTPGEIDVDNMDELVYICMCDMYTVQYICIRIYVCICIYTPRMRQQ